MTTFADIFKDANIRSSLTQFTDTHLDRLETSLFDKNGKPALKWIVPAGIAARRPVSDA